ncbi:MAG: zf-HC2 domain-containing protein [Candidatus Krumholzibacteria bacterium]|nr:zf-HC2 domain-containing protein [Candidatus Krumholzibacteria bacterium]
MECRKFRRMISRRLDGAIDSAALEELESHLASCEKCRRFEKLSLSGLSMHRTARELDPPPSLLPSILEAVEARRREGWVGEWLRFAVPAATAAAVVLGVWIGGLIRESYVSKVTQNQTDVLELKYLDEYPPGSFGYILMASSEGGGDGQE